MRKATPRPNGRALAGGTATPVHPAARHFGAVHPAAEHPGAVHPAAEHLGAVHVVGGGISAPRSYIRGPGFNRRGGHGPCPQQGRVRASAKEVAPQSMTAALDGIRTGRIPFSSVAEQMYLQDLQDDAEALLPKGQDHAEICGVK